MKETGVIKVDKYEPEKTLSDFCINTCWMLAIFCIRSKHVLSPEHDHISRVSALKEEKFMQRLKDLLTTTGFI